MNEDHLKIWNSIELIANSNGLTVSGLAKKAGLDPTIFNKSKRFHQSGKRRWISMESLSKVLYVMGMDWEEFGRYMKMIWPD